MAANATASANPMTELAPQYLSKGECPDTVDIVLGCEATTNAALLAACSYLNERMSSLGSRLKFTPQITDNGFVLHGLDEIDYVSESLARELMTIVQPRYNERATARAVIKRSEQGRHRATLIHVTVDGKRFQDGLPASIASTVSDLVGVERTRVSDRTVSFSMASPATDEATITELTLAVTETLEAHLRRPVDVQDEDPDAALLLENDYRAGESD